MIIIWGSRGLTSTVEQRSIPCPQCQAHSDASVKQVRNFFTLYFIPIIPMGILGRYVECHGCGGQYDEAILDIEHRFDTTSQAGAAPGTHRQLRAMVLAALADGEVGYSEREEIKHRWMEAELSSLDEATLEREIKEAEFSGETLNTYVATFADELSQREKAVIIRDVFYVMSAFGPLTGGHKQELAQLGRTLGIPDQEYVQFIKQLREASGRESV